MYRVQKFLSVIGLSSRRDSEKLIIQGKILINNELASLGSKVDINDKVQINGNTYIVTEDSFKFKTEILLYHKSTNEVSTTRDTKGRATIFDKLPKTKYKWINVGRLDINTSGLLLFTNNGDLANKLMHPSSEILRVYEVKLSNVFSKHDIKSTIAGIDIGNNEIGKFISVKNINEKYNKYIISLTTGKYREIRRTFAELSCKVLELKRLEYANVKIGNLKVGEYRQLSDKDINKIVSLF